MNDRNDLGHFQPGHAVRGGRGPGPSEGEQIRNYLLPKKQAVLDKLMELAVLGDPKSLQLYLQYISPPARPDAERVSIDGLASATTMQGKADCIVAAVSRGEISVEAGEKALALLERYIKTVVADDHERRLLAIEQGSHPVTVIDATPGKESPEEFA